MWVLCRRSFFKFFIFYLKSALSRCILTLSTDLFVLFFFLTAKSKRAGTGKSKLTPVPTPAVDRSKDELCSDGEPVEDSDYDTDLEFEEPREEYDPTGKINYFSFGISF